MGCTAALFSGVEAWADDLGAVTLFDRDYRLWRFDYQSQVRFPDAKTTGKLTGLTGVSGATMLPTGNFLLCSNTMNASPANSYKNYVIEVKLTTTTDGLPSGFSFVRTVLTNDATRDGYDLNPTGVAINTDDSGIAANGNLAVVSNNSKLRPFYLATGATIPNDDFPGGYSLSPPNSSTQDVVYVPLRRSFFTLWPNPVSAVTIFGRDGLIGPAFYAGANAQAGTLGQPAGIAYLDPSGRYPRLFGSRGGILVTLDERGPALESYTIDGSPVRREYLSPTLQPGAVTLPLMSPGAPLRLEGLAADPATGNIYLFNRGAVTGGTCAFILVPIPKPCPADVNLDGFIDFYDFHDFVVAFETGTPQADVNRDGFIDYYDFDDFMTSFETGC